MGVIDEAAVGIARGAIFITAYVTATAGFYAAWLAVFVFIGQYVEIPVPQALANYGLARELVGVPFTYPLPFTAVCVGWLMKELFPSLFT